MWHWFSRRRVRQALDACSHVRRLVNAQRDLLKPAAITELEQAIVATREAARSRADKAVLDNRLADLETVANRWLRPYPRPAIRENIEVVLVAVAVALGIRTFFLQPFKIPTGSMQPTLYGVTSENLLRNPDYRIPGGWTRFKEFFQGVSYVQVKAAVDGPLESVGRPVRFLIFGIMQSLVIGGRTHVIWFPPDYGGGSLESRAEIHYGQQFRQGQDVVKLRVVRGDHLFVDRLSYNFRRPRRGEIIVFETRGISGLPQDQYYIKRMVALGDDQVRIGNDRHLVINGSRVNAATPHFERLYQHIAGRPRDSDFSGHVNGVTGHPSLAPLFPDESAVLRVRPRHYLVMGDNTLNSHDSRAWGDFAQENVIGKSFFVYWPFSSRFGWWGHR